MNTELSVEMNDVRTTEIAPSADFVRAVSSLLDTDPEDLLAELGYYDRSVGSEARALTEPLTALSGEA